MMVSPEWYDEENLKGKTADERKALIRSLQRKIRKLEKEVKNPPKNGCMLCPSPEVQLEMHRLYLQEAMKALKE
jgi:hypothetical protein